MSKLITGKEALIALVNGDEVEFNNPFQNIWIDIKSLSITEIKGGYYIEPDDREKVKTTFRLKPHTITINGVDINAPERSDDPDVELLEFGREYWLVDLANYPDYVISNTWKGDPPEYAWADRGLIHLSRENATAHAKALIGASGGTP